MRHARWDEMTGRGVVHTYRIFYPSGRVFDVRGVLCTIAVCAGAAPAIREGDQFMLLDPRALITRDGLIVSDPRRHVDTLPPEMQEWLREHPEWPRVATEATPVDRGA